MLNINRISSDLINVLMLQPGNNLLLLYIGLQECSELALNSLEARRNWKRILFSIYLMWVFVLSWMVLAIVHFTDIVCLPCILTELSYHVKKEFDLRVCGLLELLIHVFLFCRSMFKSTGKQKSMRTCGTLPENSLDSWSITKAKPCHCGNSSEKSQWKNISRFIR